MSKVCENAAFAGMGDERWRMECGDRPVGKGRRVAHVGQGEVGRGRGVVHVGQGRRGAGWGGVVRARWVIGIAMVRMGSGRVENARNVGSSLDATISVRGKSQDGDIGDFRFPGPESISTISADYSSVSCQLLDDTGRKDAMGERMAWTHVRHEPIKSPLAVTLRMPLINLAPEKMGSGCAFL